MKLGGWFGEVSKSLRDGFFADNVVLALARAKRDSAMNDRDRELFRRASDFLGDAIAGYEWIDQPTFTAHSANDARLFGKVVRTLTLTSAPVDFVAHLRRLQTIAQALGSGAAVDEEGIQRLRDFFASYSRAEMEHSDQLFAPKGRGAAG